MDAVESALRANVGKEIKAISEIEVSKERRFLLPIRKQLDSGPESAAGKSIYRSTVIKS